MGLYVDYKMVWKFSDEEENSRSIKSCAKKKKSEKASKLKKNHRQVKHNLFSTVYNNAAGIFLFIFVNFHKWKKVKHVSENFDHHHMKFLLHLSESAVRVLFDLWKRKSTKKNE